MCFWRHGFKAPGTHRTDNASSLQRWLKRKRSYHFCSMYDAAGPLYFFLLLRINYNRSGTAVIKRSLFHVHTSFLLLSFCLSQANFGCMRRAVLQERVVVHLLLRGLQCRKPGHIHCHITAAVAAAFTVWAWTGSELLISPFSGAAWVHWAGLPPTTLKLSPPGCSAG